MVVASLQIRPKVTNLQVMILINGNIAWLQISMGNLLRAMYFIPKTIPMTVMARQRIKPWKLRQSRNNARQRSTSRIVDEYEKTALSRCTQRCRSGQLHNAWMIETRESRNLRRPYRLQRHRFAQFTRCKHLILVPRLDNLKARIGH